MTTKRLTIDRARWLRGDLIQEESQLLSPMGRMCCLGFYLEACGVPREKLLNESCPSNIEEFVPKQASWLGDINPQSDRLNNLVEDDFIGINDDPKLSDKARELRLTQMFKKRGVRVRFVGRLTDTEGPATLSDDEDYSELDDDDETYCI